MFAWSCELYASTNRVITTERRHQIEYQLVLRYETRLQYAINPPRLLAWLRRDCEGQRESLRSRLVLSSPRMIQSW